MYVESTLSSMEHMSSSSSIMQLAAAAHIISEDIGGVPVVLVVEDVDGDIVVDVVMLYYMLYIGGYYDRGVEVM